MKNAQNTPMPFPSLVVPNLLILALRRRRLGFLEWLLRLDCTKVYSLVSTLELS